MPISKLRLGERYCTKPKVDMGTCLAAWANKSKGTEVTTPVMITITTIQPPMLVYAAGLLLTCITKKPSAKGATIMVSAANPVSDDNFESFFTKP